MKVEVFIEAVFSLCVEPYYKLHVRTRPSWWFWGDYYEVGHKFKTEEGAIKAAKSILCGNYIEGRYGKITPAINAEWLINEETNTSEG